MTGPALLRRSYVTAGRRIHWRFTEKMYAFGDPASSAQKREHYKQSSVLVEDDPMIQRLTEALRESAGYLATSVESARLARQALVNTVRRQFAVEGWRGITRSSRRPSEQVPPMPNYRPTIACGPSLGASLNPAEIRMIVPASHQASGRVRSGTSSIKPKLISYHTP